MRAELEKDLLELAGIGQHRLQPVLELVADLDRRPHDLADRAERARDQLVEVERPGSERGAGG